MVGGVQVRRAGSENYIIVPCLSGIATRREGKGREALASQGYPGLVWPVPIQLADQIQVEIGYGWVAVFHHHHRLLLSHFHLHLHTYDT